MCGGLWHINNQNVVLTIKGNCASHAGEQVGHDVDICDLRNIMEGVLAGS